jgi:hypothetical protein
MLESLESLANWKIIQIPSQVLHLTTGWLQTRRKVNSKLSLSWPFVHMGKRRHDNLENQVVETCMVMF